MLSHLIPKSQRLTGAQETLRQSEHRFLGRTAAVAEDFLFTNDRRTRALHPRRSFEIWRETVRGRCQPWEPGVIAAAKNFREALLRLVLRRRG